MSAFEVTPAEVSIPLSVRDEVTAILDETMQRAFGSIGVCWNTTAHVAEVREFLTELRSRVAASEDGTFVIPADMLHVHTTDKGTNDARTIGRNLLFLTAQRTRDDGVRWSREAKQAARSLVVAYDQAITWYRLPKTATGLSMLPGSVEMGDVMEMAA